MKIYISTDLEGVTGVTHSKGLERPEDRRVSWTQEDYETAFKMFIGVMRLSRSDPDYG